MNTTITLIDTDGYINEFIDRLSQLKIYITPFIYTCLNHSKPMDIEIVLIARFVRKIRVASTQNVVGGRTVRPRVDEVLVGEYLSTDHREVCIFFEEVTDLSATTTNSLNTHIFFKYCANSERLYESSRERQTSAPYSI